MPSIDINTPPLPPAPPGQITTDDEEPTAPQPIVGIIYPPPEVRNIVDKTASFVARNGPEFESRIRQNELGNPKFNFLNVGDPYNAYYQHKVKEIREGKGEAPVAGAALPAPKTVATATQQKQQEILKQIELQFEPKDPPPEYEFLADPPSISALDLDIVKLTAQFVARNGRTFLTNLMNREQRNYQFDFLRPQHSLFQYFTKLLEQYTKILIPPKDLMGKLKEEGGSAGLVLDNVKYRADWIRHQEAQRRKEELALEKERVAYAQIDWHDFFVVETVDYMPGEVGNFPPPTTPDEVGARVLMQERMVESGPEVGENNRDRTVDLDAEESSGAEESEEEEEMDTSAPAVVTVTSAIPTPSGPAVIPPPPSVAVTGSGSQSHLPIPHPPATAPIATPDKGASDNIQVQDMEEESSSESDDEGKEPQAPGTGQVKLKSPMAPPNPEKVIIKKYNPKTAATAKPVVKPTDDFLISPINGERIPASKVQEHMRIGLLDPRWVEQRDKNIMDRINQENVYAQGAAIEASLKQLAERRTDIFGVGDEETAIGKKIGEEDKKKDDKVTWDGYTSSVEAATRAARANITIEEQIHQIHKVKGLLPDEEKEKIGPKPVGKSGMISGSGGSSGGSQGLQQQPPLPTVKPPAPPLPPPPVAPPPPLPPPPPPQPPIMMVPSPIRAPLMVAPGGFPVVPGGAPFMAPPGTQPVPPPPQSSAAAGLGLTGLKHASGADAEEEPPSKKMKSEESLIPEAEFLANNKGSVSFKVLIPVMADKTEWRLGGQALSLTMSLTDTVATLKSHLQEATGMPPPKQKLQSEGLFFKDSNSLAFYNISPTTVIHLVVKERGGRKK